MEWKKVFLSVFLGSLLIIALPRQGEARTFEERSLPAKSCLVVSSAFVSVPYFVSKMIYAVNGSIVAGGINIFSLGFAQDTATTVGCQAVNGDWIVFPTVLTKERNLEFVGKDESVEGSTLTINKDKEVN
jgi:hypothetical protein